MDLVIRSFRESDKDEVIGLWNECNLVVPWNDPQSDIERKQTVQSELFLIGLGNDEIIATAMVGYEGHRGWVNYLAVNLNFNTKELGNKLWTKQSTVY